MNENIKFFGGCLLTIAIVVGIGIFATNFFIGIGASVIGLFTAGAIPGILAFIVGAFVFSICLTISLKIIVVALMFLGAIFAALIN